MAETTDDFVFSPTETSSRQVAGVERVVASGAELQAVSVIPESVLGTRRQVVVPLSEAAALVRSSERLGPAQPEQRVQLSPPMETNVQPPPVLSVGAVIMEEQAASNSGYEHYFLDKDLASEYNCQICLSVSRDPQQTKCCGSTFCLYCIQRALKSSKAGHCPICTMEQVELIPDKAQKQKINKLKVQCPIQDCAWIVELADIEAHTKTPHPLTPPHSTPQSTLQRRQQRTQDDWPQMHSNTLPAQPRGQLGVGVDQPVPSSPPPDQEGGSANYINTPEFLPPTEQGECSESTEYQNFNQTFPRPRVPRKKSQSPQPEAKRVKISPYVNLSGPEFPPPLEPLSGQPPVQLTTNQTTDGSWSETHDSQALTGDNLMHVRPKEEEEEEAFYVNVEPRPTDRPLAPPLTSQTLQKVESFEYLPSQQITFQEQQQQSQLDQQLPAQQVLDQPLPHQPSSNQHLSDKQLIVAQPLPLDETEGNFVPVPNETAANLPIASAHSEFGQFQFPPSPSAGNGPDYFNVDIPSDTPHTPHIQTETEGILLLPPDLLALVDNPTHQQSQVEPSSSDPFMDISTAGFVLSPSPPSRLATPLLPAPALLDFVQPQSEEPPQPPTELGPSILFSPFSPYENMAISLFTGTEASKQPPDQQLSEESSAEVSHQQSQHDYVNTTPLQKRDSSQAFSTTPYENVGMLAPFEGAGEPVSSSVQPAACVELPHEQQQQQLGYYNIAPLQQITPSQPIHTGTTSPPLPWTRDTASSPAQPISEAEYVDMPHSHQEDDPDTITADTPVQTQEDNSEYYVFVQQPQVNEGNGVIHSQQDAYQPPQPALGSQPDYINVHEPQVTHSSDAVATQTVYMDMQRGPESEEYVDMQRESVSLPHTVHTNTAQPPTVCVDESQAQIVRADGSQPPTEYTEVSDQASTAQCQPLVRPLGSESPSYETIPVLPPLDIPDEHMYETLPPTIPPPPPPVSPPPHPPRADEGSSTVVEPGVPPPPLPPRNSGAPTPQKENTPPTVLRPLTQPPLLAHISPLPPLVIARTPPEPNVFEHIYEPFSPPPPPPPQSPPPHSPALPQAEAVPPTGVDPPPPRNAERPAVHPSPPPQSPLPHSPASRQAEAAPPIEEADPRPPQNAERQAAPPPQPPLAHSPPSSQAEAVPPTEEADLPPQQEAERPAAQQVENTPPPVPLGTRTPPPGLPDVPEPQQASQEAPPLPATQPALAEVGNLGEAVPHENEILQEVRQGNVPDQPLNDLPPPQYDPPQYDDLSQRYDHRVFDLRPAQQQQQEPPEAQGGAFIIQNDNAGNVSPAPDPPIRMENVNIRDYQRGGVDQRDKAARKTKIILWLFFSILFAILWFLITVPLSIAALFDALDRIEEDKAPFVPSCDYSVPFLFVVILAQVLVGIFIIYWFSKCCKCARSRKASRVATSLTAVTALLYGAIVIGFSVSVFVFVNKTTNKDSSEDSTSELGQNSNSNDDGSDSEVCIHSSSPPFLFATFYLLALLVFLVLGLLMTCCDYHYKKRHQNFLRYLQDVVQIYENTETVL